MSLAHFPLAADDSFPNIIPDVPLHGTDSAPLGDLLARHSEIRAAVLDCSDSYSARRAAQAAAGASTAAVEAATAYHEHVQAQEQNANYRFDAALRRRQTAWSTYLELLGRDRVDDHRVPPPSYATVVHRADGKGKGRAPPSEDVFDDDETEGVSSGMEGAAVEVEVEVESSANEDREEDEEELEELEEDGVEADADADSDSDAVGEAVMYIS